MGRKHTHIHAKNDSWGAERRREATKKTDRCVAHTCPRATQTWSLASRVSCCAASHLRYGRLFQPLSSSDGFRAKVPLLAYAAINLQPPSHIMLYQASGSSAAVRQSHVKPNRLRSCATQSVHPYPSLFSTCFPHSPSLHM